MDSSSYSMAPPVNPLQQTAYMLQSELAGLFHISRTGMDQNGRHISFAGRLLLDAESGYEEVTRRFAHHGYTPIFQRERNEDIIVALQGVAGQARTGNPLINVLLLIATIITTLAAGAAMSGESLFGALLAGQPFWIGRAVLAGLPFAGTLLLILGVHELGHYVAARWHGVAATLPYFIPLPFGGLGTLGAFIALKSPMKDRKVLFDVGIAGPLAGFVMAVPLLFVGLWLSYEVPYMANGLTLRFLGSSLLVNAIVEAAGGVSAGQTLALHPVFFAAWLGFLLTGINLLPIGQLDGGHIAYALFGRRAHTLAVAAFVALLVAGTLFSTMWYIWAFFVLLGGLRHPPPLNDITSPNWPRQILGLLAIVLCAITVTPVPFHY